jgi:hypothetical protein
MTLRACLAAFALTLCSLAAAAETPHWVHHRLLDNSSALPRRVLVIPASIKVYEMSAGGVNEEVPAWTKEASRNMLEALSARLPKAEGAPQGLPMPRLSAAESALVDEHLALYSLVVATAGSTDFKHKVRRFDFTIGPGLASLQQRTGADAALMVVGRDYASTAGRKTKAVLGKIPLVNILSGDAELGESFVHVGLVDLRTGDLLWMNSDKRGVTSSLRDKKDAQAMVDAIFEWYPAIEKYRQAYAK